jgi:iron complex outermembrane recepter protein
VSYSAVNPVAGVTFRASDELNVYAAYGKGFETPTLNDLSYRSTDGSQTGLNFGLQPARSNHYEVGVKAATGLISGTLAAYYVRTQQELAVQANSGGRSVFENIGTTARKGVELSIDAGRRAGLSAHLAYTYLHATHLEPYATCVGLPCRATIVPADTRLAGVPASMLYTSATWRQVNQGFFTMLELIGHAKVYTDDLNSDAAPAYWVANLHFGFEQLPAHWSFQEYAGLDNLADRRYVGSVIVNESNSRYFEPAPGRTLFVQFTASHR